MVSEETYVEQALYWEKAHQPLLRYLIKTYQPDLALVGYPATDEIQHQFLGLVSPTLPNGAANPAYDDVMLDGIPDGRVAAAGGVHPARLSGRRRHHAARAATCWASTSPPSSVPITGSRRNSWPSTPARCWSTSACCPSRRPPTAARPTGETIGKAKACWAGGTVQIYLNVAGRTHPDPAERTGSNRWRRPTCRPPWPPSRPRSWP